MSPTSGAARMLPDGVVSLVVRLIRLDPVLGRGTCSSWEEVAPTDFEAAERVRSLIEEGTIVIDGSPTPASILRALRAAESDFWRTDEATTP